MTPHPYKTETEHARFSCRGGCIALNPGVPPPQTVPLPPQCITTWDSRVKVVHKSLVYLHLLLVPSVASNEQDRKQPNGAFRRHVLFAPSGHFKLGAVRNGVRFNTSCISYGASSTAVSNAFQGLNPIHNLGRAVVLRQGDGSSAYNYGFSYEISLENKNLADSLEIDFVGSGVESGCRRLSTLSYWDDGSNWDVHTVPSALDEASSWV